VGSLTVSPLVLLQVRSKVQRISLLNRGGLFMINWDEFEHIHVIRKLKEVIAKWFAIDVFFADDRGNLKIIEKGIKRDYANNVLNLLLQREEGFDHLSEFVRNTVNELRKTQEKDMVRDYLPNFASASFPIVIDSDFMGGVICVGYFREGVTEGQKKRAIEGVSSLQSSAR